ncbi:MAG: lysoplasmalogenase family protein [Erythrobacter sp.]
MKPALIEHRPWLLLSVIAAVAFYVLQNNPIGEIWLLLLKGAGVGFLAVYAWRRTTGMNGVILIIALALSALADAVLVINFQAGGALFAASHTFAIALYLRNRREHTEPSQRLLAIGLLIGVPIISFGLSGGQIEIAIYAGVLAAMAAAAWTSRFPRYRVGMGAVLFVISDFLIFSRAGTVDLGVLPDLLIWPLYYIGQFMIATGVVQTLRGEHPVR